MKTKLIQTKRKPTNANAQTNQKRKTKLQQTQMYIYIYIYIAKTQQTNNISTKIMRNNNTHQK